jgi:hypothetical protein
MFYREWGKPLRRAAPWIEVMSRWLAVAMVIIGFSGLVVGFTVMVLRAMR